MFPLGFCLGLLQPPDLLLLLLQAEPSLLMLHLQLLPPLGHLPHMLQHLLQALQLALQALALAKGRVPLLCHPQELAPQLCILPLHLLLFCGPPTEPRVLLHEAGILILGFSQLQFQLLTSPLLFPGFLFQALAFLSLLAELRLQLLHPLLFLWLP